MEHKQLRWIYLIILSIIWGSSFILMKRALVGLTPIQVGALRILITATFLVLIGFKRLISIKRRHWYYLTLNGFVGTFFPAFLFAYAIEKIDSSIASILNSLTPLNTLIFGALIFGFGFRKGQFIGVLIGLVGTVLLILKGAELNPNQDYFYASFILISSIGYALNINILKKYLHDLDALSITVGNFVLLIIPTLIVLWSTDFYSSFEVTETTTTAILYLIILSVFGTGIAKIMFNRLIQISNPIFSSSVTYIIPIVAISWGIFDGETITLIQVGSGVIILLGVYLVNRSK
ncbi:MAG: permease [Lutibacter sp.]|nr:MAG: permease [Lutibacter sp.]